MKHFLFAAALIAVLRLAGATDIPRRPGKVTKTIAIFPEQQVKYSTFQNFLHYWNDRPLYIDRTHRYPGNKFAYNTDASLFTDMQIAQRYGISGLCPLSRYALVKLVLDAADNHYSPDFSVLPSVYLTTRGYVDKMNDAEKENFFKIIEAALKSKSTWRVNGKAVINSYEATRLSPEGLKEVLDEAHKKFGDTFIFSACMMIPCQRLYLRFTRNGRTLTPEDIQWYTDTVQSYLDLCGGAYFYGLGRSFDYDGEYGSRIDAEYFHKFFRPLAWKIMTDPRNKGKLFGILCSLGYVNNFSGRVNAGEYGTETLRESFEECLSLDPDYIVPFEWNEWNENTCFIPTIYKGSSIERLMKYFNSRITGKAPAPREGDDLTLPNAVLSYRYQLKLGEILRFELLTIPDGSPSFTGKAELILKDGATGQVVKTIPLSFCNGEYKAQTVELATEEFAPYQVLVPELRLTDRAGKERRIANMLYIRLLPSYNNLYQYVRHVIRDDAPVTADWKVEPDGDGYVVSGKVSSMEDLRHVELLDNRDEMRAVEDAPEFDQIREIVLRVVMTSAPTVYLTGTMRILNAGKVKARGAFNDGNAEFFNYQTLEDGLAPRKAAISPGYRQALFAFDADKADQAVFEADLKQGKFSVPIKKILENGGIYALELGGQQFFQFNIDHNQPDIPLKLTGKEAKFRFRIQSRNLFPVFSLRVQTESGKVWHSLPVLPKKLSSEKEKLDIYSETQRKAVEIDIQKERIVDLNYRFDPACGALLTAAGRPDFVATLGGGYNYGSAMNFIMRRPTIKVHGHAPKWVKEADNTWILRFDGEMDYIALPMESLPRGAFTLEMELRPAADKPMVLFRTQGVYQINSFSLMSRNGTLCAGWYDEAGKVRVRTFQTGLSVKVGEWNKITVRYNLKKLTVSCNGQEESFPLSKRQLIYSACCFGGHDVPYGIPSGKVGYFQGDLRKIRIVQR